MRTKTQTKLMLLFAGVGLSIAAAKSYEISVPDNTEVAGTHLAAGDYKVKVEGTVATLSGGTNLNGGTAKSVEAKGAIETSGAKFPQTALEISTGSDGVNHITAIDLGGTKTKLTFNN